MAVSEQRKQWALNWYYKMRMAGLCPSCGKPAQDKSLCNDCHFTRYGPSAFALCLRCRKRRYRWTTTDTQLCHLCKRDRKTYG